MGHLPYSYVTMGLLGGLLLIINVQSSLASMVLTNTFNPGNLLIVDYTYSNQ